MKTQKATQRFLPSVAEAGYTNMLQMAQSWKKNESHKPKRLSDGQQTGCTHT